MYLPVKHKKFNFNSDVVSWDYLYLVVLQEDKQLQPRLQIKGLTLAYQNENNFLS